MDTQRPKPKRLIVLLSPDQAAELQAMAAARYATMGGLMRKALDEMLERERAPKWTVQYAPHNEE